MFRKKIMIVDDDKDFLEEFQEMLALKSFNVIPVNDSFSVPYLAQVLKPDLIFLDLNMDGMDGYQLAETLNRLPSTSDIPIIGMSGFALEEDHLPHIKLYGIKTCLKKPLNPEYVIYLIKQLLQKDKINPKEKAKELRHISEDWNAP